MVLNSPVKMDDVPSHFVGEMPGEDIHDDDGNLMAKAGELITEKQFRKMKLGKSLIRSTSYCGRRRWCLIAGSFR